MKQLKPIISPKIYFPGLISLVCLPLLWVSYLFGNGKLTPLREMRVYYYSKHLIDQISKLQGRPPVYPDAFRHYQKITLSGNEVQNDLYLKQLIAQVKKTRASADTLDGYQVQFSDNTKYSDVVKTLDLLEETKSDYINYNNSVYVFWVKPSATGITRSIDNKGLLFDDILIVKPKPTFFQTLKTELSKLQPFWPCLIPFAGMIFFWTRSRRIKPNIR